MTFLWKHISHVSEGQALIGRCDKVTYITWLHRWWAGSFVFIQALFTYVPLQSQSDKFEGCFWPQNMKVKS